MNSQWMENERKLMEMEGQWMENERKMKGKWMEMKGKLKEDERKMNGNERKGKQWATLKFINMKQGPTDLVDLVDLVGVGGVINPMLALWVLINCSWLQVAISASQRKAQWGRFEMPHVLMCWGFWALAHLASPAAPQRSVDAPPDRARLG